MTDLWSLSGNYLYGLSDSGFVTDSVLNPYAYLNPGQGLISGSSFAQQLSRYSGYYTGTGLDSALQAIENDPELKEKVKDTLTDVYEAMVKKSQENRAAVSDQASAGTDSSRSKKKAGLSKSGSGISSNGAAVSAQASSAYQRQMSISGRRTPTLHAPTNF